MALTFGLQIDCSGEVFRKFHLDALKEAAQALPDVEKAKFVKHVPEQVTVIPAHDEPVDGGK